MPTVCFGEGIIHGSRYPSDGVIQAMACAVLALVRIETHVPLAPWVGIPLPLSLTIVKTSSDRERAPWTSYRIGWRRPTTTLRCSMM